MLPAINYVIMHRLRDVLGGRSAIEVLTGRKPDQAPSIVLWSGERLKTARRGQTPTTIVEEYCSALEKSLAVVHEAVKTKAMADRRKQAAKAAKCKTNLRFNVGDFVLVPSQKNSAHPICHSKAMTRYQGPYEIVAALSPVKFEVRLLGETKTFPVHWRQMRRLAGPNLQVTDELTAGALHDAQRFVVEAFEDWAINTDGEVDFLVRWRGHQDEDRTWEPLEQLVADVPVLVAKYVQANNDCPDLVAAHKKVARAAKAKKTT